MVKGLEVPSFHVLFAAWLREGSGATYQYIYRPDGRKRKTENHTPLSSTHWQDKKQWVQIQRHETQSKNKQTKHNNYFFTVREIRHWKKVPQEVVESLLLEILKTWVDMVLGNLFQLILLEHGAGVAREGCGVGTRWSQEVPSNLSDSVIL